MKKKIGLFLGPLLFIIIFGFLEFNELSFNGRAILASTLWVATWWVTEAIPIPITSLLPIILFPLTGGLSISETVKGYSHPLIFLFIGGFIIAIAIEKCNLHKRIALNIISIIGDTKSKIILGVMISSAFLSMWISNTATTVMMLPIGLAVINHVNDKSKDFNIALMLSIAFSASIGGVATLIGTPPNLVLAANIQEKFGKEIGFLEWMYVGLPFSIILLLILWIYITKIAFNFTDIKKITPDKSIILVELKKLGKMSFNEKVVFVLFISTILLWLTRKYLQIYISGLNDSIIALISVFVLFIFPIKKNRVKLITWNDALKLPWGVLLLFGGGITLANGFSISGLSNWIGIQFYLLKEFNLILVLIIIITCVNFLTEITSNMATTSVVLPILIPLASVLNVNPIILMTGATISASCAYMLPVATPPNAIVFGSDLLKISDMIRVGFWMNIVSIVIITIITYFFVPIIFYGIV